MRCLLALSLLACFPCATAWAQPADISGAVILGVGSSRVTDVLERVSIMQRALPAREGAGIALVHRF